MVPITFINFCRIELWLGDRRGRRGRTVLAVSLIDIRPHFFQTLAFIDHFHHVTRDAYADVSGKAHSIKDRICGC